PSRRPKWSIAQAMICCAPFQSATLSVLITARPPKASINFCVSWAGVAEPPSPPSETPTSLITTEAPARASSTAIARPIPPPAPVTTTTLLSSISYASLCQVKCLAGKAKHHLGQDVALDLRTAAVDGRGARLEE